MKAGVDFGNSLVKAYWKKDGCEHFGCSIPDGVPALADSLSAAGITEINAIGIGPRDGFERFSLREPDGDLLSAEVGQQARGVRLLAPHHFEPLPDRFTLVSVGTGTSYVDVDGENVAGTHLGNPMGGGFIAGFGRIFMMGIPVRIDAMAKDGTPPDTLMKHRLPALDGTPMGEFVISHFNRASVEMEESDFAAGLIHCVAVSIIRDLMAMDARADGVDRSNVVFIGTTVTHYDALRTYLKRFCAMLGKTVQFPMRGMFAGAAGAYHRDE